MSTCVVTGTITTSKPRESDIVDGSATIILTLTGTTWVVAAGSAFDNQRQNIINGLDSAQSEAAGWDAEVKAKIAVGEVVRTSDTVVTITLAAQAAYSVTACDVVTATIPATAVADTTQIVATPVFTVIPNVWTFYVSTAGNDSNNGLSPDATTANVNKPFLTVMKTMNTGSPVRPGDTIYIGPGYFYSEICVPLITICSAASPTTWQGDPANAQGFKDSSSVLLAPAQSWVTSRTAAEGLDEPIATNTGNLFACTTNDPKGLTFKKLGLECSAGASIIRCDWGATGEGTSDVLFEDCFICGAGAVFAWTNGAPYANRNLTVDRCILFCTNLLILGTVSAAVNNSDLVIVLKNSLFFLGTANNANVALGSAGNAAGGILFYNNIWVSKGAFITTTADTVSTTVPIRIASNTFFNAASNTAMNAGTAGHIVDDGYNRYVSGSPAFTNVTKHATSKVGVLPNIVLPHLVKLGLEMPRSDFLGWTDAAHSDQKFSASGVVTADFTGRTVRPWGAGASIGAWQAVSVVQDTSSAITGGGTNSLKLTGAGEVSVRIPVNAAAFTVSVRTKSASYGGASYPQMIVVANPSIGVASDTTVTAAAADEETITTATITPTAKGVMEVRLVSRSSSVSSTTYFDLLITPAIAKGTTNMDYWHGGRPLPVAVDGLAANPRLGYVL